MIDIVLMQTREPFVQTLSILLRFFYRKLHKSYNIDNERGNILQLLYWRLFIYHFPVFI